MNTVRSVTQLGANLHVLADSSLEQPEEALGEHLIRAGIEAQVVSTSANLEDVFVAATRMRQEHRP